MQSKDVLPPFGALTPPTPSNQRSRRVLRALWISLPFIVVALFFGLAMVGLQWWSWQGQKQVSAEDYPAAAATYGRQGELPFPAPWVAHYNQGTTALLSGDPETAIADLELAFEGVPKAKANEEGIIQAFTYECAVRMNTSAAYETLGDTAAEAEDKEAAQEHYSQAQEWVAPCVLSGGGSGESDQGDPSEGSGNQPQNAPQDGQEAADAGERLEQKQRDLNGDTPQPASPSDSEGNDTEQPSDPYEGESDSERERREELEGRRQEQAERQREREESNNRDFSPQGW